MDTLSAQKYIAQYFPPDLKDEILAHQPKTLATQLSLDVYLRFIEKDLDLSKRLKEELAKISNLGEQRISYLITRKFLDSVDCLMLNWCQVLTQIMCEPEEFMQSAQPVITRLDNLRHQVNPKEHDLPAQKKLFTTEALQNVRLWAKPWYPEDSFMLSKLYAWEEFDF